MFNISFDFDEVTQKITNIVVSSNGQVTTRSKRKKVNGGKAILELDENKIILSDSLVTALGVEAGTRVTISYYTIDNQNTIPLIGKSELFLDKETGNKLTKSNTVSFKGIQREVLSKYGSMFTIEPWDKKEGAFVLIPITSEDEVISANEEINEELVTEKEFLNDLNTDELDSEIARLTEEEDLPF